MTNKEPDINFPVSVNLPSVYTAAHFYSGIPIIKNIILKNLPAGLCDDLVIIINGTCANKDIIDFRLEAKDFSCSEFISENSDMTVLNLEKHKILPKKEFMHELTINATVRIRVSVSIGTYSSSCIQNIKISPFGHVCPEMPPELICTYVLPDCEFASKAERRLSAHAKKVAEKHPRPAPKPLLYAEALASIMLSAKLTYSAAHREMLDGDCIIRDPDSLTESNKRSVSQTEAALLYCSCAERCGLHPGIIFLRRGAGSVKVLISIGLGDYYPGSPVSESIAELRERILDREIFVFDVLGLLGTEDTDFARNVTDTTNLVLKSSSTLVFSVDVYTARLCGVASLRPFDGITAKDIYGGYQSISDALKNIDKNAEAVSVYGYSPYSYTSLGICMPPEKLTFGEEYYLCPLDDEMICSETDSFLAFSGFCPKNLSEHPRNINEQGIFDAKLKELSQKVSGSLKKESIYVYPSKYMLSGDKLYPERIRDEIYSDAVKLTDSVKVSSLHNGNTKLYAATGIVRILEDGCSYYAPCAYIPCEFVFETGAVKLRFGTDKTIINSCLQTYVEKLTGADFAERKRVQLLERLSSDNEKMDELCNCLGIYRSICEDYPESLSFSDDTLVCAFDLSYILMRDCLELAQGKKFEQYLESGKYASEEASSILYGRLEATLPFDSPSDVRNAIKAAENDSIVISGVHGTGKKKAVGNIIARAALTGEDILVCSKYSESLDSLYDTMRSGSVDELCLLAKNAAETKKYIIRDIERLSEEPEYPSDAYSGDVAAAEHSLSVYADDLYSEFGFGYSLYDCIDEYCKCDIECPDQPIELSLQARDLSKSSTDKLFEVANDLFLKAHRISELCANGISDISEYLKYIKSTSCISKDVADLFKATTEQLDALSSKSAFARGCLGISDNEITDVRTLLSLGEFLELIMRSGIDYLPDDLLSGSTYRSAKSIENACALIDEICCINAHLADISDRIASISCTELYIKWRDAENNPFVKNSIIHEIKKYLPEKAKPTAAEIDELLKDLSRREELENELAAVSAEASASLGELWQGSSTDTERARRVAEFALSADICIKKLFRSTDESPSELQSGITRLISALTEDKAANSDFILAVSAFKKLASENGGLLNELSGILCTDLYELRFPTGILGHDGLSKLLRDFRDNLDPLFELHELNLLKKEASLLGLSEIVTYLENGVIAPGAGSVIKKSIFLALAKYIISTKIRLKGEELKKQCHNYMQLYFHEKKLARFNIASSHRKRFRDYISDDEGKNELYALRQALEDKTVSVVDILSRHSRVLRVMYTAIFTLTSYAYRLEKYRSSLILMDCEKTDAAEGLPLCANFDKCIFISSPFECTGSIMSSLPLGIPVFRFNRVLSEKNGYTARFLESLFADSMSCCCSERNKDTVRFIKCGGLYDKNARANKIEAVQVCETALTAAKEYCFENVGIIASTPGQTAEIISGLELLSNKYADARIADIPVKYMGNMGDFTKDCIIFSVAFGKNIYSVTRSFGITDDISKLHSGSPISISELLCCNKQLYVVASADPEEIMTDNLCKGARTISALLMFAKYGAVQMDLSKGRDNSGSSGIIEKLYRSVSIENREDAVRIGDGIITHGSKAMLYENGYIRDTYDRIILPYCEATNRGYDTYYSDICSLIATDVPTEQESGSEK